MTEDHTPNDTQSRTVPDPLFQIYQTLLESVLDENGYGGPVCHEAEVDGWTLRMTNSDFGDLAITARKEGSLIAFEYYNGWVPFTTGTSPSDLAWLTDLALKAEWRDIITRSNK